MAPKKKQQKQKSSASSSNKPKPQSSSSTGPKLQISSENEQRLRRLLLNSGRSTTTQIAVAPADESLSREQKAKRLRSVYENLSCEGFLDDQIERALSALKEGATFEAALDWLCLNLPGNELPLKFSTGTSLYGNEGGNVGVLSTAQENWSRPLDSSAKLDVEMPKAIVRTKARANEDTLDSCQPSQAEWIRQYLEQQEEEEPDSWEDDLPGTHSTEKIPKPRDSYDSLIQEYHTARIEAQRAKERGDKKRQQEAGGIIRKLKQEMSILGLSDEILLSGLEGLSNSSMHPEQTETVSSCDEDSIVPIEIEIGSDMNGTSDEVCTTKDFSSAQSPVDGSVQDLVEESEDVELGGLFIEDASSSEAVHSELLNQQKKEKIQSLSSRKNLEKLEGLWKKGDPQRIPKAVLQQLCQKFGWEAPKYEKVPGKENNYIYAVSILRKASGRGKSRKAGGLVTLQLPSQEEAFASAEDGQNRVAAFALYRLFPDLPIHLLITEPYASDVLLWEEGESPSGIEVGEENRRAGFVDSLLNDDGSGRVPSISDSNTSLQEESTVLQESMDSIAAPTNLRGHNKREKEESYFLRQELEKRKKMPRYKEMLKTRAALPIAELKSDLLGLLKQNDVVVVCGETGSGKTTQVPQYVLDDMIEAGCGGYCSIVCTQPRRIANVIDGEITVNVMSVRKKRARSRDGTMFNPVMRNLYRAISVAERVADERCESSPGSTGSLVGYQVRLDSARNENTKLLFCTTGILLRKIAADKNLAGITHVIVDEVHERSLLGDFLLTILKNLVEKRSGDGSPKLKVILMSATVDSDMFSRYFGGCPVITAEGRTHPVSTYFLEDIYEQMNYRLASDSPAYLRDDMSAKEKNGSISNHRGKKNLVLSGWGDEALLAEDSINPYYISSCYQSYNEQTRQNLRRLNEDVIDYDILEDLVHHIDGTYPAGAILVFLPGVAEIHMLLDKLAASYQFGGQASEWLLPLHSSIASTDQKKVFLRPPDNIRKVIVATNIAETSITIDDVVYVIDGGKHKENRYNPQKKLSSMVEDWISQANARQRRGRAGRVKPGICFCLYTRHRFEKLMRPFQIPEMLRMPLVELCLQIKLLNLGNIKSFLLKALEPPREEAINSAISLLFEVAAIEKDENLTPLGYHLAKLPVDVLIGKMMIYGAIFGCLSPILSIAAFLSYKSPFVYPKDERQNVERAKLAMLSEKLGGVSVSDDSSKQSDHLLMMVAYRKWEKIQRENGTRAAQGFCSSYFLSSSVMHMIRDMRVQFGTLLADIGLVNLPKFYEREGRKNEKIDSWLSDMSQSFNSYSQHSSVLKAIICAGLYPNVAATEEGIAKSAVGILNQSAGPATSRRPVWYDGKREVHIHPSSINNNNLKSSPHPFVVFLEKIETNKVFLRDTTIVSPYSILLFGGSMSVQHQTGLVTIDGWIKLAAPAQIAVLFKELRLTLHSILEELIRKPQVATVVDNEVLRSIIHLLLEEGKATM